MNSKSYDLSFSFFRDAYVTTYLLHTVTNYLSNKTHFPTTTNQRGES
jgi:hypothetical protein